MTTVNHSVPSSHLKFSLVAVPGAEHVVYGNSIADTDSGKSELGEVVMGEDRTTAHATEKGVFKNTCTHMANKHVYSNEGGYMIKVGSRVRCSGMVCADGRRLRW